jgi:FkbM family methyltransferase
MPNTGSMNGDRPLRAWLAYRISRGLDLLGSWLLLNAPPLGRIYASAIRGRAPRLGVVPGWRYAHECYPPSPWWVMRRRALWQCALDHQLDVSVIAPWLAGTRVGVSLGNNNGLFLYVCGSYEPNELAFVDRVLHPGMTFIDIGANEGLYTLFAARRVGPSGRVIAVEPSSRERAILQVNLARNRADNVMVVPNALADRPGTAELKIAPTSHGGHNTLGQFVYEGDLAVARENVDVETLDGLVERLGIERVDVVKVDIEGAELKLLAGGRNLLSRQRPILLLEANDEALKRQGASAEALVDLLLSLDYQIQVFNESGMTEPWVLGKPLSENIVAFADEKAG